MLQKTTFELSSRNKYGNNCEYFQFSFGGAREPKNGEIDFVQGTNTCREGLILNMRQSIVAGSKIQPTDKFRMIFKWTASEKHLDKDLEVIDGWLKRSIPVLQAFDRAAGWPLTKIYKIDCKQDWLKPYYFLSSRRWMKSSYLVSLYVLLVRMCKDERITGFKDLKGLIATIEKLTKSSNLKCDGPYVKGSLPYWEAIMKGYPRLFRKRKMDYYWNIERLTNSQSNSGSAEGIHLLTCGSTKYPEVRKELLKIKDELNTKKKVKQEAAS